MKKLLLTLIAATTILSAQAQLFSPESVTGAAIGAIAGGVIGHNSGRHGGEGAAIGAGVGFLAGALVNDSRRHHSGYYSSPGHGHISVGISGGHHRSGYYHHNRHYGHGGHYYGHHYGYPRVHYYAPSVYYRYAAPVTYLEPQVVTQPVVVQQQAPAPAPAPQPQQVTIINNYYGNSSPMTGANGLFGR